MPDLTEAARDADAMGLPAAIVADLAAIEPAGFKVWSRNMPIVAAFLAVATQWSAIGTQAGIFWMGLDYVRAKAGLEFAEITLDRRQWAELRVMELAARSALNGQWG